MRRKDSWWCSQTSHQTSLCSQTSPPGHQPVFPNISPTAAAPSPPSQLMTVFQGLGPISIVVLTFESSKSFGILHKGRGKVYSTAQNERWRKWKRRGKPSSGEINVRKFSFRVVLQISWCFLQAMQDQGWWSGLAILAISIDQPFNKGLWSRSKSVGWEISSKLIISISSVAIQIIKGETSQERILAILIRYKVNGRWYYQRRAGSRCFANLLTKTSLWLLQLRRVKIFVTRSHENIIRSRYLCNSEHIVR